MATGNSHDCVTLYFAKTLQSSELCTPWAELGVDGKKERQVAGSNPKILPGLPLRALDPTSFRQKTIAEIKHHQD
jgi:hypothetical protein